MLLEPITQGWKAAMYTSVHACTHTHTRACTQTSFPFTFHRRGNANAQGFAFSLPDPQISR